jgi:hypothetical protein
MTLCIDAIDGTRYFLFLDFQGQIYQERTDGNVLAAFQRFPHFNGGVDESI